MSERSHYPLSFIARHPSADLHELAQSIGLPIHRIWKRGDKSFSGKYQSSYAALNVEKNYESARHALTNLIDYLYLRREILDGFAAEGGSMCAYLTLGDGENGITLSVELLEKFCALNIEIGVDSYP